MRHIVCLLSLALAATAADLPVREVVLFKHGVGYFARSGHLGAGESARLDFGPWQQIYYAEFDGRRSKRVIVKVMGE